MELGTVLIDPTVMNISENRIGFPAMFEARYKMLSDKHDKHIAVYCPANQLSGPGQQVTLNIYQPIRDCLKEEVR